MYIDIIISISSLHLVRYVTEMLRTKELIVGEIQCDGESGYSSEESKINSVLPNEIFIHCILKYLDLKGLDKASRTCKKWNNHVRSYFSTKGDSYM